MSRCQTCKHWKYQNKNPGYNGCAVWNLYKHLGKTPPGASGDFEKDLNNLGPVEVYEGWVKMFAMGITNFSIVTKAKDVCHYYAKNRMKRKRK